MMTEIYKLEQNMVKNLRTIRDQISIEIKDMSFEEERAWLDKLLAEKEKFSLSKNGNSNAL